jgi:hypothetical protein
MLMHLLSFAALGCCYLALTLDYHHHVAALAGTACPR